ncbi:DUF4350 domain-containing protein [Streptomyces sp. NPDC089799]|uniref:DUF4350 domain-containing protein n=1 Tax=Streptomyces sp. NPDC089799 TaxID=3155066 RepID=UPI003445AB44
MTGTTQSPTTTSSTAATSAAASTSTAPGAGDLWRRFRGFLVFLAVLVTAGVVLALFRSGAHHGSLDPRSAEPAGSRAVAELLRERGVTTRVVTTAQEAARATGSGTTLLIASPNLLGPDRTAELRAATERSGGRTVLLSPRDAAAGAFAPGTDALDAGPGTVHAPACTLPAAVSAGTARTGGDVSYRTVTPTATGCYPQDGRPTLLVVPGTAGGDTVLLGSAALLRNENLADGGNASLALQLLGSRPQLVWYLPSLAEATAADATEEKTFVELIPAGWGWALLQLTLAAAVAALWRGRRLGPLVTERLPVAVRASEATEGRARLYRRAGARDRAADVLRAATRERLAALLGVPASRAHDPAALLPAVSHRLTGSARDLTSLLFGTTPADDAALVALADHLDALEREVRTS